MCRFMLSAWKACGLYLAGCAIFRMMTKSNYLTIYLQYSVILGALSFISEIRVFLFHDFVPLGNQIGANGLVFDQQ